MRSLSVDNLHVQYKIARKSSFTQIDFKWQGLVTTVCLISDFVSPHGTLIDILGVGGYIHHSDALFQERASISIDMGLDLPQNLSVRFGEQKNVLPLKGFKPRIV